MAEYIDREALIKVLNNEKLMFFNCGHIEKARGVAIAKDLLKNAPTADVVPRAEVTKALNEVELLIIITKEMYKQQMEDAPNELSKQSKRTKWVAFEKFYEQFAELKKKYTEGNDG